MRLSTALCFVFLSVTFGKDVSTAQDSGIAPPPNDASNAQEWVGVRTAGEYSQPIVLHVESLPKPHGTVDLPDFGALGIPAAKFAQAGGKIHFELVGDTSTAVFDGNVASAEISGHWHENERSGDFRLRASYGTASALRSESVAFQSGNITLSGTLLLPSSNSLVAAIVFVHGAGPETRQASLFLAQYFAQRNVAALIYDKRGTGQSSGDWKRASFEDLSSDVEAAVKFLKSQPGIDGHRIGLMGSSQGGWIAPMAALHIPDLAFVIIKSAAAVTPEQQELARVEIQMQEAGDSPAEIAEAQRLYKNAIEYARSGLGWESLRAEIERDANKRWSLFAASIPKDYWFFEQIRLFFDHNPVAVLERLSTPLLVVFGGRDDDGPPVNSQVGPLLAAMQANGKISQLAVFPNAGHGLRVEPTRGQPLDFARFAPGYLQLLGSWVNERIGLTEPKTGNK
jgi:pimeloyl-ACP methyl ester carboxylesterase